MKKMMMKSGFFAAGLLALSACTTPQETLYYWGNNNADVYERLKDDGKPLGEQISNMEKYFRKAESEHKTVAPGAHAHMGLLLSDAGQNQQAAEQFEAEKKLFPESSVFMDFLLKNKQEDKK
ncbi:MAG: DUF4810 domain-containing protein [Neisseria sp.]|uniref:DUF4810 domain-containing protein n=1 Tax=Neisseria sp. TaxID=192066 RepID=UPI0026DBD119|nr:DUF4810 domain-containing protein [Neisseria sp.]MDO4640600.1 DUF4810 domain-containing protein [Neisseria sp.]